MNLPSTTIRTALIDYRANLIRMNSQWPDVFKHTHPKLIADIDAVLLSIEGNVTEVSVTPVSCKLHV